MGTGRWNRRGLSACRGLRDADTTDRQLWSSWFFGGLAAAAITLGEVTAAGEGTVGDAERTGSATVTLGDTTASGAAESLAAGSASITVGAIIAAGEAAAQATGHATVTLGEVTSAGTAASAVTGIASATLAAVTLSGEATIPVPEANRKFVKGRRHRSSREKAVSYRSRLLSETRTPWRR